MPVASKDHCLWHIIDIDRALFGENVLPHLCMFVMQLANGQNKYPLLPNDPTYTVVVNHWPHTTKIELLIIKLKAVLHAFIAELQPSFLEYGDKQFICGEIGAPCKLDVIFFTVALCRKVYT